MISKQLVEIEQTLHMLALQGKDVCLQIERNQARKPLSDRFHVLDREFNTAPFAITVLGVNLDAREASLAWLLGQEQHLLKIHVPQESGLVELTLQEQGYVLEKANGERCEFDHIDGFLDAISQSDLVRAGDSENWISPLRFRIPVPPEMQGITLCIPENISILSSPAAFNRLVLQSNLLLLCAPANYLPDEESRKLIEDLSASMDAVWPLILSSHNDPLDTITPVTSPQWPSMHGFLRSRLILPPLWIPTSPLPPTLGGHYIGGKNPLRRVLILTRHGERLRTMFELTIERFEEEQHRQKKQQRKAEQELQNQRAESTSRELSDKIGRLRSYLSDETSKLTRDITDASRQSNTPKGELGDTIRQIIENINEDDLKKEDISHSTRLEVSPAIIERIETQINKIVKNQMGRDLGYLRDARDIWAGHLREELAQYGQTDPVEEAKIIDDEELWENLQATTECNISWRGEIPRTGFQQFFRAAYSPLIMGSMVLSIILTAFEIKFSRGQKRFAIGFIIAFIFMLVWARKELAKKHKETIEKELFRVRETLRSAVDRIFSTVNQEKNRRIGAYLSDLQKDIIRRLEQFAEKISNAKQEQMQREMILTQNKIKQAEKSIRESNMQTQELQRLFQKSRQTREESLRLFQDPDLQSE